MSNFPIGGDAAQALQETVVHGLVQEFFEMLGDGEAGNRHGPCLKMWYVTKLDSFIWEHCDIRRILGCPIVQANLQYMLRKWDTIPGWIFGGEFFLKSPHGAH